jgi:hypothetical protein
MVLGADAQTLSWSYVLVDFPRLKKSETPAARAIAAAQFPTVAEDTGGVVKGCAGSTRGGFPCGDRGTAPGARAVA